MEEEKENKKVSKTRNYATVVYEESAPSNWVEILGQCFVPAFISPYHQFDVNEDGTPKKPHYHVMIMFDNTKTEKQAREIFNKINGVGCEKVNSVRGMARYLCHMDNPEKYRYNEEDVKELCGADYFTTISLVTDKYKVLDEMIEFCEKYNVTSFYLLSKYAFQNKESWRRVLADSGSVFMREYLKSKQWSTENNQLRIVDEETGEVII